MMMTSTVLKMCLLYTMAIDLVTCSDQDSSNRPAADRTASVSRVQWKSSSAQQRHSARSQHTKNTRSEQSRYTQNGSANSGGSSASSTSSSSSTTSSSSKNRKPNIVLILTDDQDVELGKFSHIHSVCTCTLSYVCMYNSGWFSHRFPTLLSCKPFMVWHCVGFSCFHSFFFSFFLPFYVSFFH